MTRFWKGVWWDFWKGDAPDFWRERWPDFGRGYDGIFERRTHGIFEMGWTIFWRGADTDSDQDKGEIAPLGRRPSTNRTIFDTFLARIEEMKGKLTATLASWLLNLHEWSTSNLRINSSSTHEEKWTCSSPLVHNTHIVAVRRFFFFFLERKVNMVRIWLLTKEDIRLHPMESSKWVTHVYTSYITCIFEKETKYSSGCHINRMGFS